MSFECKESVSGITFDDKENFTNISFFWRDSENGNMLANATINIPTPKDIKNIDEIKKYALQKAKEFMSKV
jgi:hypothetical protein